MNATIDTEELDEWLQCEIVEMRELGCSREADEASIILRHVREMRDKNEK